MSPALSLNFTVEEYAVSESFPHLVEPVPDHLLLNVRLHAQTLLQPIREHVRRPVQILSGYRSRALNDAVGGSPTSQHRKGEAADITLPGHGQKDAVRTLFLDLVRRDLEMPCGQTIWYPSRGFIHVASPSLRYPTPSFHVHEPVRGLQYLTVRSASDVLRLSDEPIETLADPEE